METVIQEALRLISSVPEDEFITGQYVHNKNCCSVGHFIRLTNDPNNYTDAFMWENSLNSKVQELIAKVKNYIRKEYGIFNASIVQVNDTTSVNGFTQEKIKDRVVTLLTEMVAAGY